jgi:diguanylate cyclase (GGDEF)-like protein
VTSLRSWIVAVVGAAVIATAVLGATERQRTTSERNFDRAQTAWRMQVAMLNQERGLDRFLATGSAQGLQLEYGARLQLAEDLGAARAWTVSNDAARAALAGQADSFSRWSALATTAIARRQATGVDDTAFHERQRSAVVEAFLADNETFQEQLLVARYREERSSALLPVWLLLALGALLGGIAVAVSRRKQQGRVHLERFNASQGRYGEAIQFAASEAEAHQLLGAHLENNVPGGRVLVLNRNNSADRLEPTRAVADGDPLREALLDAQPRSCLAVRLSRPYRRGPSQTPEALHCTICGELTRASSCQPLLVGGEVIGAVLVEHNDVLTAETESRLAETVAQSAPVLANLRNLAIAENRAATDALTGLPNRRTVDDTLRRMLAQADRTRTPFSVALLDLDHFKQINDSYGHESGDNVLAGLAALLRAELRASDFAGRNGGEEFVVFLPDTNRADAVAVVDKIRLGLHDLRVAGIDRTITTSIGVASYPDDAMTSDGLMRIADRSLYSAKQRGRDRVETNTSEAQAQLMAL